MERRRVETQVDNSVLQSWSGVYSSSREWKKGEGGWGIEMLNAQLRCAGQTTEMDKVRRGDLFQCRALNETGLCAQQDWQGLLT